MSHRTVALKAETYDRLTEICRKTGFPKTQLLSMLINEIFILCATMDDFNLEFDTNLPDNILHIILRDRKIRATEQQIDRKTAQEEAKAGVLEVVVKPKVKGD
jgi:hypothetical protein